MPAILDRAIDHLESDAFGHRHFAIALQDLIESSDHRPPFSIGLLGRWGVGKSSVKEIYLSALRDDRTKTSTGKLRRDSVHAITFNAWRFGGENIKRALLRHVYLELGGEEESLTDTLFREVHRATPMRRPWRDVGRDYVAEWLWFAAPVGVLLALLTFVIAGWWIIAELFDISEGWVNGLGITVFLAVAAWLVKFLWQHRPQSIPRYAQITRVELPRASSEEYEDLLVEQLRLYKAGKAGDLRGVACERLVIFVDDLDRLSAEEMVSGLDAVRTFMEISEDQLPQGMGIVFVISCDEERIATALADRRSNRSAELPGTVFNRADARRYLDRIFQFRLEIPPFPAQDLRSFARQRLVGDLPWIAHDLQARDVDLDDVIDRLIHVGVQSPRNAVQLLNAFSDAWWLARRREFDGAGTMRAGGLSEGAVTRYPIALAALCVLRVDFPDFYVDLQQEPTLIRFFTDVFLRGQRLDDLPEIIRNILARYQAAESDGQVTVKLEYRPLRQYLASLQGLPWPSTLQPLLLLSQDPVTRQYGDRSRGVFDALVSGDHRGVLSLLGRDRDATVLSHEDARLLSQIDDELTRESPARRNNAAAALAAIADRFEQSDALLVLTPVARRLNDSAELRWQLGVDAIAPVLTRVPSEDRRAVTAKLVTDLLRPSEDIDFRTQRSETPSLDEAIAMVRATCSLALNVRKQDGLPSEADRALLTWLETRHVAVAGRAYELPFNDLEGWISQHEDQLLLDFGSRYATLLANELSADRVSELSETDIIRRSRDIFDRLWVGGEESREQLWELLIRYIGVRLPSATKLAWQWMDAHRSAPGPTEITTFIAAFAERLHRDMVDQGWSLDWEDGGETLLGIVDARQGDLRADCTDALVQLANDWSIEEATGSLAVRLVDVMRRSDISSVGPIVDNWTGNVIGSLAPESVVWLADHTFDVLNDQQRTGLVTEFEQATLQRVPSAAEGTRFRLFMDHLPEAALTSTILQAYFGRLVQQTTQSHSNPDDFLFHVFPVVPRLLPYVPAPAVGQMLHTLTRHTASNLRLWGWINQHMTGYWPSGSSELAPYDPELVFSRSSSLLQQHPNDDSAPLILRSILDLHTRGIVADSQDVNLLNATCAIWPYYPAVALEVITMVHLVPSPDQTAGLQEILNISRDDVGSAAEVLSQAWTAIGTRLTKEQRRSVTRDLLQAPPNQGGDEPDLAIRLWFDAQGTHRADLLATSVVDAELNDDQLLRVWHQIDRVALELGRAFFETYLPMALSGAFPATVRFIFDRRGRIAEVFGSSQNDRYDLGTVLLRSLVSAASVEARNQLAAWLGELVDANILRELPRIEGVDLDDIEILKRVYPQSKRLQRWRQ